MKIKLIFLTNKKGSLLKNCLFISYPQSAKLNRLKPNGTNINFLIQ